MFFWTYIQQQTKQQKQNKIIIIIVFDLFLYLIQRCWSVISIALYFTVLLLMYILRTYYSNFNKYK